jgi:hypothetical protein
VLFVIIFSMRHEYFGEGKPERSQRDVVDERCDDEDGAVCAEKINQKQVIEDIGKESEKNKKEKEASIVDTLSRIHGCADTLRKIAQEAPKYLHSRTSLEEAEVQAREYLREHRALGCLLEYVLHGKDAGFEVVDLKKFVHNGSETEYYGANTGIVDERGSFTYIEHNYVYDMDVSGIPYRFALETRDCIYDNKTENGDEHFGRIDFGVRSGDDFVTSVTTNIGMTKILSLKPYIRDFYRFLRLLNGTDEIQVEASKAGVDMATVEDDRKFAIFLDTVRSRFDAVDAEALLHVDVSWRDKNCVLLCFSEDVHGGGGVQVQWKKNGDTELMGKRDFLYRILEMARHGDLLQKAEAISFFEDEFLDNKKEQQRLKLYRRILERMDFSVRDVSDEKDVVESLYAEPSEDLEKELFDNDIEPSSETARLVAVALERIGIQDASHYDALENILTVAEESSANA